jgi:lysyl-tRNA synthetase class I
MLENLDFGEAFSRSNHLYDVLACTLRRRKENKTPLKTLCLDCCVISTKQVNSLQKLVWEVRWDGDEGHTYDEYDTSSDTT